MNQKEVVGKKIVGLRQVRDQHSSGKWGYFVDAILCEDGSEIRPLVCELEHGDGYGVQLVVVEKQ